MWGSFKLSTGGRLTPGGLHAPGYTTCIVFSAISWPSLWSSSYWLDIECFTLWSCWCMPSSWRVVITTWFCSCLLFALWLHVYSPPNFFVSDLAHSGISCSFSETPHLCCQHLPFFAGEVPVFTPDGKRWMPLYDCVLVVMLIYLCTICESW